MLELKLKQTKTGWLGYLGLNSPNFMPILAEMNQDPIKLAELLWTAAKRKNTVLA